MDYFIVVAYSFIYHLSSPAEGIPSNNLFVCWQDRVIQEISNISSIDQKRTSNLLAIFWKLVYLFKFFEQRPFVAKWTTPSLETISVIAFPCCRPGNKPQTTFLATHWSTLRTSSEPKKNRCWSIYPLQWKALVRKWYKKAPLWFVGMLVSDSFSAQIQPINVKSKSKTWLLLPKFTFMILWSYDEIANYSFRL